MVNFPKWCKILLKVNYSCRHHFLTVLTPQPLDSSRWVVLLFEEKSSWFSEGLFQTLFPGNLGVFFLPSFSGFQLPRHHGTKGFLMASFSMMQQMVHHCVRVGWFGLPGVFCSWHNRWYKWNPTDPKPTRHSKQQSLSWILQPGMVMDSLWLLWIPLSDVKFVEWSMRRWRQRRGLLLHGAIK